MATPGWYPDPSGQPQMFRYWDGQSWSEQTTSDPSAPSPGAPVPPPVASPPTQVAPSAYPQQPVDPYQQQAQQPYAGQPQPGQYAGGGYGGTGYPPTPGAPGGPGGSNKGPLLIGLAVLLILAIAVGGFFGVRALTGDDDGDDSASDDSSQTPETEDTDEPTDETEDPTDEPTDETEDPTDDPTTTGPTGQECTGGLPGAGGEVSGDQSISGGDLTLPPVKGYDPLEPQIATTFAFADGIAAIGKPIEEQWIALYAVGGLPKASGYSDLAASVDQVITCMTESPNFYRNFSSRDDLERESITVDGHDAYSVTSEIRVDDPDVEVEGDVAKVIVVDTGDDEHFGLYVSVVPIGNQKLIDQQNAASEKLIVDD